MTKQPGDDTPPPEGGRAAERLREFRKERMPSDEADQALPGEDSGDRQPEQAQGEPGQAPDES